jgi:poly(3-hydroxybutyrate) depolymerase
MSPAAPCASPLNPAGDTLAGRAMAAGADLFESLTRYYGKPEWDLSPIDIDGASG